MNRYALFAGRDLYEPMGGMDDLVGLYPSVEAAMAVYDTPDEDGDRYEWYQILDRETFTVVDSSR